VSAHWTARAVLAILRRTLSIPARGIVFALMLNNLDIQPVVGTIATRRSMDAELRAALETLPPSPWDWSDFDPATVFAAVPANPGLELQRFAQSLCAAPARSAELQSIWSESLMTGSWALKLAPHLGADPRASAIAGLLHRLGDLLTIRALAHAEQVLNVSVDAAVRQDLCSEHGSEQLERAVRAWGVPPRAAAMAALWRRLREFPSAAAEATAVYLARLFAIESLQPQFAAPGLADSAALEAGISPAGLSALRGDANIAAAR
jgi:hypothetical protein